MEKISRYKNEYSWLRCCKLGYIAHRLQLQHRDYVEVDKLMIFSRYYKLRSPFNIFVILKKSFKLFQAEKPNNMSCQSNLFSVVMSFVLIAFTKSNEMEVKYTNEQSWII